MTYLLSDEIRRLAQESGDSTALTDERASWTFSELDDRSTRFANAMRSMGVRAGDRIAVLDKNSTETVEALFGTAKAGAVATVLNWRFTPTELRDLLRHAAPTLAIIHVDFLDSFRSQADSLGFDLPYVTVGGADTHAIAEYEAWLASASPVDDGYRGSPDDVIIQIYTSGTTGPPKGALATNRAVGAGTRIASFSDYGPGAHFAVVMPMFHIGGIEPLLIGFSRQCPAYIVRDLDPVKFLDLIERERISHTFLVPTVIELLVTAAKDRHRDLSSLRTILYGSSPITPAALRRALDVFGPVLVQIWGSTETCGAISQLDSTDHDPFGPREYLLRSAGKAYPWFELRVVEPGTATEVRRGETGEFIVRTEQRVSGYHDNPQAARDLIDYDGWLHTGDLGYLDNEGFIFLTDRLKDMIISGGENVYPIEVEAILSDHPGVGSVAVFGAPDERWGERVVAAVVAADGQPPTEGELDAFARIHLAPHKRPKSYVFVDSLPLTPSGKVLKKELRAQAIAASV